MTDHPLREATAVRPSRRQFWVVAGLALAAPAGCGDAKKDSTTNPDLGPPPNSAPPKRVAPPGEKKK